ncbi:MAG: peptidoglycan DD-metalloendopeptidase family protein [Bacilli bacterium]|nr:peptidoglycan DD-metalloendopeptidase family protein [Bacilli bacterium]MBP3920042.1 peptidoglycan DD-metalloendopeptidase family protein [Bacilli bacterium]
MNSLYKKIINVFLCFNLLVLSFCVFIPDIGAKTLGQLESELANKQKELDENKNKQHLTEEEMRIINNNLATIKKNMEQIIIDTDNLEKEIQRLSLEIAEKQKEIKSIISYFQVSSGESAYLDYVMGATDFTDFIYRSAVSEQLTQYNDELIDSYNATIDENNNKKIELANKSEELRKNQAAMNAEHKKLGEDLANYSDEEMIITDEVKSLKEMVQMYKNKGCKANEDINTCGQNILPPGTSFYRQLKSGYVTSWYGGRDCSDPRVSCGHYGIDLSTGGYNVPVYSIGTGIVASMTYKSSCGGNMVFVHHKLTNGQTYTSVYMHLHSINVSQGQTVTKDTVIGIMGGGSTTPWDYCSTGAHSHLGLATGLYGIDYSAAYLKSHYINPANIINFPKSLYTPFNDRTTAF